SSTGTGPDRTVADDPPADALFLPPPLGGRVGEGGGTSDDSTSHPDLLAEANAALVAGNYDRVAALSEQLGSGPTAAALRIRALANVDPARAAEAAAEAVARHPSSAELLYLQAVL